MLSCGCAFYYWAICMSFFSSDVPIIGKFFVGLLMVITFLVLIFFVINFRILIIHKNEIISIYPFLFKCNKIEIENIKNVSWDSIMIRTNLYKKIIIKTSNGKSTSLSDLEFENFDTLISKIPNTDNKKSRNFDQYQAENHQLDFNIVYLLILNGIVLYMNFAKNIFHWIHLVFYFVSILLILVSVRRIKKYNRINKNYR